MQRTTQGRQARTSGTFQHGIGSQFCRADDRAPRADAWRLKLVKTGAMRWNIQSAAVFILGIRFIA